MTVIRKSGVNVEVEERGADYKVLLTMIPPRLGMVTYVKFACYIQKLPQRCSLKSALTLWNSVHLALKNVINLYDGSSW